MPKPERILTRHYKNGIINARPDDDPWHYPPSSSLIPAGEGEYIRADLGSFYQEKDIDALAAERDALRQRAEKAESERDELRAHIARMSAAGDAMDGWTSMEHAGARQARQNWTQVSRAALRQDEGGE